MRVGEVAHLDQPVTVEDTNGRPISERVVQLKWRHIAAVIRDNRLAGDAEAARVLMRRRVPNLARILWLYRRTDNSYECCIQVLEEPPQSPHATLTGTDIRRFANGQMFINDQHVGEIRDLTLQPSPEAVDEYRRLLETQRMMGYRGDTRDPSQPRPNTSTTRRMQVSWEVATIAYQRFYNEVFDGADQDKMRRALGIAIQRVDSSITQVLRYQVYPEDLTIMVIYEVAEGTPPLADVSALPSGFIYSPYIPRFLSTAIPETANPDPEPNALPEAPVVITKDPRPKTIEEYIETPRRRRERSDIMD